MRSRRHQMALAILVVAAQIVAGCSGGSHGFTPSTLTPSGLTAAPNGNSPHTSLVAGPVSESAGLHTLSNGPCLYNEGPPGSTFCVNWSVGGPPGETGTVTWTLNQIPTGWTSTFNPNPSPVTQQGGESVSQTVETIVTPSTAKPGNYTVKVTATFADGTHVTEIVTITITTACNSATPPPQSSLNFAEYPIAGGSQPNYIINDPPSGTLFYSVGTGNVSQMQTNGTSSIVNRPNRAQYLTLDPTTGTVWVDELNQTTVQTFSDTNPTGPLTTYNLPVQGATLAFASALTSDGNVWFTDFDNSAVYRLNPTTQAFTTIPLQSNAYPGEITVGSDGNVWFTELGLNQVGRINVSTNTVTTFAVPLSPLSIISGSDGNLWVSGGSSYSGVGNSAVGAIYAMSTTGTLVHNYKTGISANADPFHLFEDIGTGLIWFSEAISGKVATIKMSSGKVAEYTLPSGTSAGPVGLTIGPDARLWVVENAINKIAAGTVPTPPPGCGTPGPTPTPSPPPGCPTQPPTLPTWAEYNTAPVGNRPNFITNPNSANALMYFTTGNGYIASITTAGSIAGVTTLGHAQGITTDSSANVWALGVTNSTVVDFPAQTQSPIGSFGLPSSSSIYASVRASDGNVYVTDQTNSQIVVLNPTTSATSTIPVTSGGAPAGITIGPDGNVWFAETGADKIGRITVSTQKLSEFSGFNSPQAIVSGSDGNLWVTGGSAWQVGNTATPSIYKANSSGAILANYSSGFSANANPFDMHEALHTGLMWFTEIGVSKVASINMATGTVIEYPTASGNEEPIGVTIGPDSNLWITENVGAIATVAIPTPNPGCSI
ncbi:MAG: hypothetical protein JOZ38_08755 [Candidatus Eremiobacteraeota bacterium]|nr:hypothetical protein [Candidatus Eremiobacteraeota bacterium]